MNSVREAGGGGGGRGGVKAEPSWRSGFPGVHIGSSVPEEMVCVPCRRPPLKRNGPEGARELFSLAEGPEKKFGPITEIPRCPLHCQGGLQRTVELGPVVWGMVPKDGPGTAVHSCGACWWAGLLTTASKEDTPLWTECKYSERRYFCNALAMNGAERRRYYCNALPASHTLVS